MKRWIALTVATLTSAANAQTIRKEDVIRPAGSTVASISKSELLRRGEALFADQRLSPNEISCAACHADLQAFNDTFKRPYPHFVKMAKDMAGLDAVNAESMVQFCMLAPMAAKPFAWDSPDLAALTEYIEKLRGDFARK